MRVRSSKMRVFSVDRNIVRMKFPTGFNLYGFPVTTRHLYFMLNLHHGRPISVKIWQVIAKLGENVSNHGQGVTISGF